MWFYFVLVAWKFIVQGNTVPWQGTYSGTSAQEVVLTPTTLPQNFINQGINNPFLLFTCNIICIAHTCTFQHFNYIYIWLIDFC